MTSVDRGQLERFVEISSAITGYEVTTLWGTGQAEEYFTHVRDQIGEARMTGFIAQEVDAQAVMQGNYLVEARAIIKLWYLGTWHMGAVPAGTVTFRISPQAYVNSLAWTAMGGHPQGAKQPGYGSWSVPPVGKGDQLNLKVSS
jgi:hypothetical protein